jgi:hypothetical protein
MNKFQRIVNRRIQSLLLDAELAGEPRHNSTAGFLREKYIINFLRDMTPSGVSLTSGVIFDASDVVSPQLDLIAVDNSTLPAIVLHEGLSMVPVEATLLTAEIKSILTSDGLKQVTHHNQQFRRFRPAMAGNGKFIVPTIILALESDLSKTSVVEWMQSQHNDELVNGNTVICCVIGKFHLVRQGDHIQEWDSDGEYQETLSFISDFWGGLKVLQQQRHTFVNPSLTGYPHPLEVYLKGLVNS